MDGIAELAKMLKDRENGESYAPMVGAVIDDELRVAIKGKIILTSNNLIWCKHVVAAIGDNVLLLPTASKQKFYVIGVI